MLQWIMTSQSASSGSSLVGKALASQTTRYNAEEMRSKKVSQLQALRNKNTSWMNEAAKTNHFQSISAKEADLVKEDSKFQLLVHLLSKLVWKHLLQGLNITWNLLTVLSLQANKKRVWIDARVTKSTYKNNRLGKGRRGRRDSSSSESDDTRRRRRRREKF